MLTAALWNSQKIIVPMNVLNKPFPYKKINLLEVRTPIQLLSRLASSSTSLQWNWKETLFGSEDVYSDEPNACRWVFSNGRVHFSWQSWHSFRKTQADGRRNFDSSLRNYLIRLFFITAFPQLAPRVSSMNSCVELLSEILSLPLPSIMEMQSYYLPQK